MSNKHIVTRESDEYCCSCGTRWGVGEEECHVGSKSEPETMSILKTCTEHSAVNFEGRQYYYCNECIVAWLISLEDPHNLGPVPIDRSNARYKYLAGCKLDYLRVVVLNK